MTKSALRKTTLCLVLTAISLISSVLTGCNTNKDGPSPENPVTVTMWHNYGAHMKDSMDTLVDEFNNTVGLKHGVIINVTSISSSKEQNEKLTMIAAGDPGAPKMPDIVTAYPSMALTLTNAGLLASLDEYFEKNELAEYVSQFVEEGRLPDGKLYVFPIAKSTEALFVNKTTFDRFSEACGVSLDNLATFEGIADAAVKYYEWTSANSPGGGKAFFTADSWFNIAMIGTAQLDGSFASNGHLNTDSDSFRRIWDFMMMPALKGGFASADGYSSDLAKTGDIVCSIGSTAGVLFYGNTVTHPDNSSEHAEYIVLPYPTFTGGTKIAIQRGAGMVIAKSDTQHELGAALFLKWLTAPDPNLRFVLQTGYLPVTMAAFEKIMSDGIGTTDSPVMKSLLETAAQTYSNYAFVVAPNIPGFDNTSKDYENNVKSAMHNGRQRVTQGENAVTVSSDLYACFGR